MLGGLGGLGVLALAGRLAQLQIVESQRYSTMSASNQFNLRLRTPPRGRITDRNGTAIAASRPEFRLLMRRDEVHDIPAALSNLAQVIPISVARQAALARQIAESPRGAPVEVASDLSWDEFSRISVRTPELPGVIPDVGEARVYPLGGAFAHVIGYVSRVTEHDIDDADDPNDRLLLDPGFRIGKQGVEKALDAELRGKPGYQKVEVDSVGRVIRYDTAGDIPRHPRRGGAAHAGRRHPGPRAGAVRRRERGCGDDGLPHGRRAVQWPRPPRSTPMSSSPARPAPYYKELSTYDHKPLLDKALSATFPPGSTFKTLVAMACLENGFDPKTVHVCNRSFSLGNHTWHCDQSHGPLNLSQAITASCDVYFYQAILTAGPEKVADLAKRFGLMQTFDIGVPGQHKGLVGEEAWKRRAVETDPKWHPGDTVSMGIGQGYVNVNPLQLCVQCSRIANGGKAVTPRLVHSIGGAGAAPAGVRRPGRRSGLHRLRARGDEGRDLLAQGHGRPC